jgi:hypothetical protein
MSTAAVGFPASARPVKETLSADEETLICAGELVPPPVRSALALIAALTPVLCLVALACGARVPWQVFIAATLVFARVLNYVLGPRAMAQVDRRRQSSQ